MLSMAHSAKSLNFRDIVRLDPTFAPYQFVRLGRVVADITMFAGVTRRCYAAFSGSAEPPTSLFAQQYKLLLAGSSVTATQQLFELPANSAYDHEVKALNFSNPPPFLHFRYGGGTNGSQTNDVKIHVVVEFQVGGSAPVDGVFW